MTQRTCPEPGCARPSRSSRQPLCDRHYRQQLAAAPCSVDGCERKTVALGYCDWHYRQLRPGVPCEVEGCERMQRGRGLCSAHLKRRRKHGNPLRAAPVVVRRTAKERLTEYTEVIRVPALGPCHEWNGLRNADGYGVVSVDGKRWLVPRLAWTTLVGPIPEGLQIRHHCDNPPCFWIEHLALGTTKQNQEDKVKRGRQRRGVTAPNARFNREQVLDIRRRRALTGISQYALADEYGVAVMLINRIVNRRSYAPLPMPTVIIRRSA